MERQELKLLNSKTPGEYIDNSLKSRLPAGRKAYLTKLWLEKTGRRVEEIQRARNRHPYWKKRKMKGSPARNLQRRRDHDYSENGKLRWNREAILEFLRMNKKDKRGRYLHRDYELAQHFNSSIPSIQHYRRKQNMVCAYLKKKKISITPSNILPHITKSEKLVREMLKNAGKPARE